MQTKENQKEMYSFTEVYDAYDQKKTYVTFKRESEIVDVIVDQFLNFIDNIEYCQYTGLLLKKVEENDLIYKYEVIDNAHINQMRQMMFMQICNKEERGSTNEKAWIKYRWNQLFAHSRCDRWNVQIEIEQYEPDLIKDNRTKPKHYLYVILDTITNMHKIGITSNVERRYKTLLSDRFSLTVSWACELENKNYALNLEKQVHKYFINYRNIGEWFNLSHLHIIDIQTEIYTIAENIGYELSEANLNWIYDNRYSNLNGKG